MSLDQRIRIANNIYVSYPRFKEIIDAIEYCHHFSSCKDEPECMFLSGTTGVGKTRIYRTYASKYARYRNSQGATIPILATAILAPATVKAVVSKLLWEQGDPAYDKGSIGKQTIRLIGLIRDCGVQMLILDEFQHFIDRDSAKVLKTVSDWLKTLILDTNLTIILIGLPEAEQILKLKCHSQLSRKFANRCCLSPFSWQSDDGEEFRTFLHMLESQLPLESTSNLSELNLARRFYYACDGVVAYVIKLIRYGTYLALQQDKEYLDISILAVAFEKYVSADKPDKMNPFLSDEFDLPEVKKEYSGSADATNNRSKSMPKKRRDPASPSGARESSTREQQASSVLGTK